VERLDDFLSVVPGHLRWAVELRDASWLHDDVFDVLRRHGVALCIHDLLPDHPWVRTTDWLYVRFHGPEALENPYRGPYGPERLGPVADRLQGSLHEDRYVYAYFNNDYDAHAVADARWLAQRLGAVPAQR
jgi:uncharacterized protein YecE (DUF72 family)